VDSSAGWPKVRRGSRSPITIEYVALAQGRERLIHAIHIWPRRIGGMKNIPDKLKIVALVALGVWFLVIPIGSLMSIAFSMERQAKAAEWISQGLQISGTVDAEIRRSVDVEIKRWPIGDRLYTYDMSK
jgi:hypothetical protein